MTFKNTKNLLSKRDVYNRYYGDFRGVDFSSDHTQVIDQRLAYAVNMYKDYQSAQGKALETIAGFRKRLVLPEGKPIYGIHQFKHREKDGSIQNKVLVHSGNKIYLWHNYPYSIGVLMTDSVKVESEKQTDELGTGTFDITFGDHVQVSKLYTLSGASILIKTVNAENNTLTVYENTAATDVKIARGDTIFVEYYEGTLTSPLFNEANEHKSESFIFNNRLYIIDGKNYLVYDGEELTTVLDKAYIPTTYTDTIPSGDNADAGKALEPRNTLQPKFKQTFIPDGLSAEYYLNERNLDKGSEVLVTVFGDKKTLDTDFTVDYEKGIITFLSGHIPPVHPDIASDGANGESSDNDIENASKYPSLYAGVEITAQKSYDISKITDCTIFSIYDERVFLSGNPNYPNHVFFCALNNPTYFPPESYMQDGVGMAAITGMLVVADTLMVLKEDTQQDGSVYFHSPQKTENDLYPKIYPASKGLAGIGCLGACVNFLDDPVFISRLGVEAVGQLSVRYERAIEHRSSLIDAKLVNLGLENLKKASFTEWNGYLIVLVDGKIFMADSRQRYTHETGVMQYEWYYLEDIGVFENQYLEYRYAPYLYKELKDAYIRYQYEDNQYVSLPIDIADSVFYPGTGETKNLTNTSANSPDENGMPSREILDELIKVNISSFDGSTVETDMGVYFAIHEAHDELTNEFKGYKAYLCESKGNYTGGQFRAASIVENIDENLFFGTENGVVCSFNFDKRDEQGEIPTQYYSFDNRTIYCGCATKMDCCGVPHLTKNTVKKSTVIKTKSLKASAAKIKVRTNKKPYNQIARIGSSIFSFEDVDFSDFSFITAEQTLFSIKEKEKQWVEKQYFIYSDEYLKPLSLYYVSYRYNIAGRYKD